MKKIFRITLLFSFALATENQFFFNLTFTHGLLTLLKVSAILMVFELLIKPILKLLLLPINILTLGLFRGIINTIGFYLAVFLLSDFTVGQIHLTQPLTANLTGFWSYLLTSFTSSAILYLYNLILRKK